MAYTAPPYTAVNFQYAYGSNAYVAPNAQSVNFMYQPEASLLAIYSETTASFFGKSDLYGAFSATGTTTTVFEQPYRDFQINGSGTAGFVTWQRDIHIPSGTPAASFRSGSRFTLPCANATDFRLWATVPAAANIVAVPTTSFAWMADHYFPFSIKGQSYVNIDKRDNQPSRFSITGRTKLAVSYKHVANVEFTIGAAAHTSLRARSPGSEFAMVAQSAAGFSGWPSLRATLSIAGNPAAAFASKTVRNFAFHAAGTGNVLARKVDNQPRAFTIAGTARLAPRVSSVNRRQFSCTGAASTAFRATAQRNASFAISSTPSLVLASALAKPGSVALVGGSAAAFIGARGEARILLAAGPASGSFESSFSYEEIPPPSQEDQLVYAMRRQQVAYART